MDKTKELKQKYEEKMENTFAVLGDGWALDPVMRQLYIECIESAREYAQKVSRGRAIGFYTSRTPHLKDDKEILESVSENYDIWRKSNQEE